MFFKLGFKNLIRQMGKTLSFFLLLLFVCLFLVLSVSMRTSSGELLESADKSFLTIATLDYRGMNYPNGEEYDGDLNTYQNSIKYDSYSQIDGVKAFEPYIKMRGYIGEYPVMLNKRYGDMAVILFKVTSVKKSACSCRLLKCYTTHNKIVDGMEFTLNLSDFKVNDKPIQYSKHLKKDHLYLATGEYVSNRASCTFTPKFFLTQQLKIDNLKMSNQNFRDINKFFLTPELLCGAGSSVKSEDFYELAAFFSDIVFEMDDKTGVFIDVTDNPDVFSECIYDEKWLKAQPEIWEKFALDAAYTTKIDWKNMLYAVAKSYEVMSNSIDVVLTDNPEYQPVFHQHTVPLTEGGYYTEKDGKNVCLISSILAYNLKLEVGDSIHIDLHNAVIGDDFYNSYFYGTGFKTSGDFRIVGIYKMTDDIEDTIFIPTQSVDENQISSLCREPYMPTFINDYTLGTFILENSASTTFVKSTENKFNSKCTVTVYDQGYINIAAPLESMQDTSLLLICICSFTGICIILLFAYIFIVKQKDTAKTMLSLGTGNGKTLRYLMSGALILALLACALGAVIGYFISDSVLTMAYKWAAKNSILDLSYSTLRTSVEDKAFNLDFSTHIGIVATSGAVVFIVSLLVCGIFANRTILSKNRAKPHKTPLNSIKLSFRSAFRSIRRTLGRSVIVPTVSLSIILLISIFCGVLHTYTQNIDSLYETVPVEGQFVTLNGISNDNLLLDGEKLADFVNIGYVKDFDCSYTALKYNVLGYYEKNSEELNPLLPIDDNFDGTFEKFPSESNVFAYETYMGKIQKRPNIAFTSNLETAPEFFATGIENIKYADGYDNKIFASEQDVCVIPQKLMDDYDLSLNETLRLSLAESTWYGYVLSYVELKIIGVTNDSTNRIFAPLYIMPQPAAFDDEQGSTDVAEKIPLDLTKNDFSDAVKDKLLFISSCKRINAFNFKLTNGKQLKPIKSYLESKGYSYPSHIGTVRTCIVINDTELQNSVNGLAKVKGYLETLYPVMYIIIIAIAFVVSYLLVRTRTTDIAIMRSMGSGNFGTFFTLFIEQLLLVLIGTGMGVVIMTVVFGKLSLLQIMSIALYVLCYAVGLIIAVCAVNSVNVLKILSSKD